MFLVLKKRRILHMTCVAVVCYLIYQFYFFISISSEKFDKTEIKRVRTESTTAINILNNHSVMGDVDQKDTTQFKCVSMDHYIPSRDVNDDYCDCEDGTDETNTNACPKGRFVCRHQDSTSESNTIPSSMVNDGICDCCDGSDEWNHEPNKKLLSQGSLTRRRHFVDKCPNICGLT